ncbi:UDP-4-amino-4,6-dideoxy-N-acetyl-beta-L-altrosamine N-acetyltransferase [Paenibacillus sp. PK3_47]|nr:UDP-4-amino-4,6-dideoxy-N-acetyl-beta-L-altrosamine N-acetyltransferase [Paenibacillus sp. PK3_47]
MNDYTLKQLGPDEINLVWEWRNADHIRPFMNQDDIIPLDEHIAWVKAVEKDASKVLKLCFYQEKPVGLVSFSRIDSKNHTCEWGFYIGDKSCPAGSGKIMGILALDYIFKEQPMRKVCAQILDFNWKSLSYHRKLGFAEEGRLVRQILRNHKYVDVVLMSLFKEQWEQQSEFLKEEVAGANEGNTDRQQTYRKGQSSFYHS